MSFEINDIDSPDHGKLIEVIDTCPERVLVWLPRDLADLRSLRQAVKAFDKTQPEWALRGKNAKAKVHESEQPQDL